MSTSVGEVGVEIRRRLLSVKETNGPGASGLGFVAVSAHRCQAGSGLDAPFRGSVPHFFQGKRPRIPREHPSFRCRPGQGWRPTP